MKIIFGAVVVGSLIAGPRHDPPAQAAHQHVTSASDGAEACSWEAHLERVQKEARYLALLVDIQQKGNVQEIGIDGRTGKVVENKSEGRKDKD